MKKALVCDWLDKYSGAERCVESFTDIWNDFDIFSLVDFLNDTDRSVILKGKKASVSFIQNLPFSKSKFRNYLPFFPYAIEQFDLNEYDLVLSSSHCVAKGILTNHKQFHICYMHTPIRYAWDMYHSYLNEHKLNSGLKAMLVKWFLYRIRMWDYVSANRADKIIANSKFIASRIEKIYSRKADVIYPPVDTDSFTLNSDKDDYYVTCSRLVAYKKVDVIIRAFNKNGKKLVVIGDGEEMQNLKVLAKKNIELVGFQSSQNLKQYLQGARAFVFAAVEDFGISVVEAMACGTPVIALKKGGACESVEEGVCGNLFCEQNEDSLNAAIVEFEKNIDKFDPNLIRQNALKFSKDKFKKTINEYVNNEYEKFKNG
ncbi:glycosyltransferase [Campylobacter fetus]|uniref:Glycosyltransferase, family 1 n=3 Tax=Campylobacter fetus TaxID=196 RepID=A0AAE6IYW6_CAMFE|nr:glycosyltransferase [Campylobacter fetus]OCS25411.1 glycosyl transferase family 1 [Campylobacter fetus subsp. venerealis cfvB10]OCS28982.1 glycosyl transferase family 1 [Campylobacter fetus subsp. venerealis LMG 6570 = CCUG 33900]ABK82772.1 glycosyl transferase, group 1 [Campylobacter fetus subsp. fetus 82-40]AIR80197.1 glycosyltransferase, family 1 [Campylobacter fetus subsp. venerealis 97/608]EAH8300777.1 glycosyltransferase family 4 protein [Campylobacter fetus]